MALEIKTLGITSAYISPIQETVSDYLPAVYYYADLGQVRGKYGWTMMSQGSSLSSVYLTRIGVHQYVDDIIVQVGPYLLSNRDGLVQNLPANKLELSFAYYDVADLTAGSSAKNRILIADIDIRSDMTTSLGFSVRPASIAPTGFTNGTVTLRGVNWAGATAGLSDVANAVTDAIETIQGEVNKVTDRVRTSFVSR